MIQYQLAIDLEPPRLGVIESDCFWLQNVRSDCFLMVQRECFSAIKKMFSKIYVTFQKYKGHIFSPDLALTIGASVTQWQPIQLDSTHTTRLWFWKLHSERSRAILVLHGRNCRSEPGAVTLRRAHEPETLPLLHCFLHQREPESRGGQTWFPWTRQTKAASVETMSPLVAINSALDTVTNCGGHHFEQIRYVFPHHLT